MDDSTFTPSEAARGAGIDVNLLKTRINRGHFRVVPDLSAIENAEPDETSVPSRTQGAKALFSIRRFFQVVIAEELVANGVPVQAAYDLAMSFSDIGEAVATYGAEAPAGRRPGELFKEGRTLLIAWREGNEWRREIKQALTRRFDLEALFGGGRRCVVVLDVGDLVREAMRRITKPANDRADAILRAAAGDANA